MKRLFTFFFALLSACTFSAYADVVEGTCGDNLTWTLNTEASTLVIDGTGAMADYYSSSPWYAYRAYIKSVTLPDGLTSIGNYAFDGCSSLTSITIPNSVTSIGDDAFYNCSGLTSITIPNSVTSIGNNAFEYCESLTSITIPNSVTSIGKRAFYYCRSLTSVTLGNSVTSIGDRAFGSCSSLTSIVVEQANSTYDSRNNCNAIIETATNTLIAGCQNTTIPNNVTSIGNYAFDGCSSLTSVTIPNSVTSIGDRAFSGIYSIYMQSSTPAALNGTLGNNPLIYIPDNTKSAYETAWGSNYRFVNNETSLSLHVETPGTLADLIFESGIRHIHVTKLTLSGTLNEDDFEYMYDGMTSLGDLDVSEITNTSGIYFKDASKLVKVILPKNLSSISYQAFYGCRSLTSITIPNSVTSIGNNAFDYCYGLTSITLGNSVTSLGNYAFDRCGSLTSIIIPNSVTSIGNNAFYDCYGLKSVTLGNSVTSIGNEAFRYCSVLTSVTIPESVTSIGNNAFANCSKLTSIHCLGDIPPTANDLGADTKTCTLIVPKKAYNKYFMHAYWGQFLNIETEKLTVLSNNDDWGTATWTGSYFDNQPVILTATPNEGYKFVQWQDGNTDNPRTVTVTDKVTYTATFAPSNDNQCGENLFWKYDHENHTLSITGTGDMFDYGQTSTPWDDYTNLIQHISLPEGITSIGRFAFMGCSALQDVNFPTTLTDIGEGAFMDCSMLTAADLNNGLVNLGDAVFMNCKSLINITVPEGVASIGYSTFYRCSNLKELSIPTTIDSIWVENAIYEIENVEDFEYGCYLIWGCTKLEKLVAPTFVFNVPDDDVWSEAINGELPQKSLTTLSLHSGRISEFAFDIINLNKETLQTIDLSAATRNELPEEMFYGYRHIEHLALPSDLEYIPYMAVAECLHLQSVSIPASVKWIDERAFENCRLLSEVKFAAEGALNEIGNWAFYNCHKLQEVNIPDGVTTIGEGAFYGCTYLKDLTLPASMLRIADNGFAHCSKLSEITVNAVEPPMVDSKTFENVDRSIPVYVPDGTGVKYRAAAVWQEFDIRDKADSPTAVENINSTTTQVQKIIRNGQLIILRDGKTYNAMGQEL